MSDSSIAYHLSPYSGHTVRWYKL